MALHMNFDTTLIPKVSKAEFLSSITPGDRIYCWGTEAISKIIEAIADGPSHVLTVWKPWVSAPWLTLEATFPSLTHTSQSGVHVGLLSDYLDKYPGNLVLTRRAVTDEQVETELNKGLLLLDDNYNWRTELSIAARKLLPFLPPIEVPNELYCSGLAEVMSEDTLPYQKHGPDPNTPEQDYTDPVTEALYILMQGTE